MFLKENFKVFSNLGPLQRMSLMTKHASKAGKVDPGDTVTVVRGATTGSTNQKAGYRSRGTNGPISVQQKVM